MLLFTMNVLGFKTNKLKHTFLVKRRVATERSFLSTSVLQNVKKLSFFWGGPLFGKSWLMFKTHYESRCFSTFLTAKNENDHV